MQWSMSRAEPPPSPGLDCPRRAVWRAMLCVVLLSAAWGSGLAAAPEVSVTASVIHAAVVSGGSTGVSASAVDDQGHGLASWSWSDGGAGGSFAPSADAQAPTYTAAVNGTGANATVTLTVTATCDGPIPQTGTGSATVTVRTAAPAIDFSATPARGTAPLAVDLADLSAAGPTTWAWDFGDGATSTEQNPAHTYTSLGRYDVCLALSGPAVAEVLTKPEAVVVSFPDVPTAPPGAQDYWALRDILNCVKAGIVGGYPDGSYWPEVVVTREQMAAFIARALAGGDSSVPTHAGTASFPDVLPTGPEAWAYRYVEYCRDQKIVGGYPDGKYWPLLPLDRGQMAVFMARAMAPISERPGLPSYAAPSAPSFPDVLNGGTTAWMYREVEYIHGQGIVNGYPEDGRYHPEVAVNRGQMAAFIARAFLNVKPVVEAEDTVYTMADPANGAGPMWSYGSSCLARVGDNVFISGLEVIPGAVPLNNVRWKLFAPGATGWEAVSTGTGRTREPCPLVTLSPDTLYLSDNPTLTAPDAYNGPAQPTLFRFDPAAPSSPVETLLPTWSGTPPFSEHSYRSLAADAVNHELMLFQNIGYDHAEWTFRDSDGGWSAQGQIVWPWGADYPTPEPIRVCYPTVALVGRKVYLCGVSDIIEPYPDWRQFKRDLTGQEWDYDFRRLFFTWSDDITTSGFHEWVEVSSRDTTCGWISPNDLWVAPDGGVHVLWMERAIDERLREAFFPEERQSNALMYAVLRDGKVAYKQAVVSVREGEQKPVPKTGRFHTTPEGRLFAVYVAGGWNSTTGCTCENRVVEIAAEGRLGEAVRIDLEQPLTSLFTASWRNGSAPSSLIDLYGPSSEDGTVYRYARVRLGG